MTQPTISVITPSYNQSEFLEKNLRSVRDQEINDIEHIVIDGGSNDGSVELLRDYESQYNLTWISEPDRGQSHAVNKGLELATGEWIGWQNSDDFYLPNAFEIVSEAINSNRDVDVIYGDALFVDEYGDKIIRIHHTRPSKFVQRYWSLFTTNQSLFARKAVWEDIGGLDEELYYTMDAKFTWEILNGDYCCVGVQQPLGAFRVQENAKTFGNVKEEQRNESDQFYPSPWYESFLPRTVLENMAKGVKAAYLLRDGRWVPIKNKLHELKKE